jgi:hypothetical protein
MSDPQLLRLREEYQRTKKRRAEIESGILGLENRLGLVTKLLNSLEENRVPAHELLESLNIKPKSTLALGFWALGLKKQTEKSLTELKAEAHKATNVLSSLTVCPRCLGIGRLSGSTKYERMQEGPIIPVLSSQECRLCGGSGRLVLDR